MAKKPKQSAPTTKNVPNYELTQAEVGYIAFATGVRVRVTSDEAMLFLSIRDQLIADNVKLDDGTKVDNNIAVLRWLLSQVAQDPETQD